MKKFVTITLINVIALFIVSHLFSGIVVQSFFSLIIASIILSLINIYIKPIIKLITLPINFLTLGLFSLFINAILLYFVEFIVKGFYISNFITAFFGAIFLSIIYILIENFIVQKSTIIIEQNQDNKNKTIDDVIDVEGTFENNNKEDK